MALQFADRVVETSTTTGTGAFTLAGALAGYQAFADVCSTSDTIYYVIEAINANGFPTGEWEVGLGTYSGTNTLTRTTVLSSSNSDSAVNFSAGTKRVFSSPPAEYNITDGGVQVPDEGVLGRPKGGGSGKVQNLTAAQLRAFILNEVPVFNFTDDGEARFYADVAMTLTQQSTSGTGSVAYEKSTAAAPSTFSSTSSPISLEAGAWLKVSASSVSTLYAVALKRTA